MPENANMVDTFLADAKGKEKQVTLYLANGYQIKGAVQEFDYASVLVEVKGKPQMVFRQGIVSCCTKEEKPPKDKPEKSEEEKASEEESMSE